MISLPPWIFIQIHCDSPLLWFETCFNDSGPMESSYYESSTRFFEQHQWNPCVCVAFTPRPEYNSIFLESNLFCPVCVEFVSLIRDTTKLYLLISITTWLVLLVPHIVQKFHVSVLNVSLVVRKGHRPLEFSRTLDCTIRRLNSSEWRSFNSQSSI